MSNAVLILRYKDRSNLRRHSRLVLAPLLHVLWRKLYENRSSRKNDSKRLFSREYDFPKTFSLTENQFSRKNYSYQIHPWCSPGHSLHSPLAYSGWKRPNGHVVHGSSPLAENVPGRHWAAHSKSKCHLQCRQDAGCVNVIHCTGYPIWSETWVGFGCSMLPSCPANSPTFPYSQEELGLVTVDHLKSQSTQPRSQSR